MFVNRTEKIKCPTSQYLLGCVLGFFMTSEEVGLVFLDGQSFCCFGEGNEEWSTLESISSDADLCKIFIGVTRQNVSWLGTSGNMSNISARPVSFGTCFASSLWNFRFVKESFGDRFITSFSSSLVWIDNRKAWEGLFTLSTFCCSFKQGEESGWSSSVK